MQLPGKEKVRKEEKGAQEEGTNGREMERGRFGRGRKAKGERERKRRKGKLRRRGRRRAKMRLRRSGGTELNKFSLST